MKKLIGITAMGLMVMVNSINAAPIEGVSTDKNITTDQGYTLSQSGESIINIVDNVSATYLATDKASTTTLIDHYTRPNGAIAAVIADEAKVRVAPDANADIINFIKKDIPVFVTERIDNWYHVEIEGVEGYIYKTQLDESKLGAIPYKQTKAEVPMAQSPEYLGNQVVERAKQYLGNPYVYGGTSLTRGADCSGYVQQVYKQFGINLQRSSRAQYASNGTKVSKKDVLPGDLVFYGYNGYIDHVAIYAGNGQIIHANSPKTGICMGKFEYGKPIVGIKRVIK